MRYLEEDVGLRVAKGLGAGVEAYPHNIIHEATSAMKRQYQASLPAFAPCLLSKLM